MAFARSVGPFVLMVSFALTAGADIVPYELVGIAGRNNIVDSNPSSCDKVEGCYSRTGARCSDDPNQLCDLQIVPAGRCTYGNLAAIPSCVWPNGAGHCSGNSKVGCLTDDQCADAGGKCLLTTDPFNAAYQPVACTCQGTDPQQPGFETVVCGGGALAVCSDGDPMRDEGGLGSAIGEELKLGGPDSEAFPRLGPAVTGSDRPDSTAVYAIENLPSAFDPQRDAGTIGRASGGPIHEARTTEAREILPYAHPTIATPVDVRKLKHLADSYWSDWTFERFETTTTFNYHTVTLACDPPVGWVVGTPVLGANHCHQLGRNGMSFLWGSDLTPSQLTAYTVGGQRICPPNCNKDFQLATAELQELEELAVQDPNAAIQVALQSGEEGVGRQAGAGDAIGVTRIVVGRFAVDNDLRCRMGGWGNAVGYVGRCANGPSACDPDAVNCGMGGACCAAEGNSCRACNGPFDGSTNPLGLPIGYNTHGRPELDLVAGQRIGGIAGQNLDIKIPLFLIETTGDTTAEFRDIAGEGVPDVDLAEMGPVALGSGFASGIGSGGTFANGTELNIDEPCCGTGAGSNSTWDAAQLGSAEPGSPLLDFFYVYGPGPSEVYVSDWALTYDKGPGPDGIPGCIGDNHELQLNGLNACRQRLGVGPMGAQSDPFFATGKDDRTILYPVGAATRPASASRYRWGPSSAAVASYFGGVQNPPIVNTVASFAARDLPVFTPRSSDLLAKFNTTACPLTNAGPQCDIVVDPCANLGGDTDLDGVCDANDNCSRIPNPGQEDGGNGLESPADGVGDVCDNCTTASNPRVAPDFLTLNPWGTLTGGQRDDDHDGYGNKCDAKFVGLPSQNVGGLDLAQFRASNSEDRRFDTCGTINTRPCAIFDLDEAPAGNSIGGLDLGRFRQLNATTPGPRCAACTGTGSLPLPCVAGTAGTCF